MELSGTHYITLSTKEEELMPSRPEPMSPLYRDSHDYDYMGTFYFDQITNFFFV